jgi:hypothetical protein
MPGVGAFRESDIEMVVHDGFFRALSSNNAGLRRCFIPGSLRWVVFGRIDGYGLDGIDSFEFDVLQKAT